MFEALATWLAAALSAAVAVLATRAFLAGRRAAAGRGPTGRPVAVIAIDPGVPLGSDLVRGLGTSVIDGEAGALSIRVATVPGDQAALSAVEEARRLVQDIDAAAASASPPGRHVAGAWLGAAAVAGDIPGVVLAIDPSARPTSRQLDPLVRALGSADLAAGCPAPIPGLRSLRSAAVARAAGDLAPVLFAVFGPRGAVPLAIAARDSVTRAALADPLTVNRPSLGAALAAVARRDRAVMVPCAVGVDDHPGAPARLLSSHLCVLSRVSPARFVALLGWLASVPAALVAWLLAPRGAPAAWAGVGLLVVAGARVLVSATWTREVSGVAAAAAGLLLSPLRDLALLWMALTSLARGQVRRGTVPFLVHRGGVLSPAAAFVEEE